MAGPVQGAPGAQYANRSDLAVGGKQAPQAATGQPYGAHSAQIESQQAVPVGTPELPPFHRPTERPNEPITAGMPTGAGPGPEVLAPMLAGGKDDILAKLRYAYRLAPNDDLMDLIIAEQMR